MAIALTLAQIIELSGGRPRRMRQFANEGIFRPQDERLGRSARVYPISEAAIACIVARLDRINIQSGALAGVAEGLRHIYRAPLDYNFKSPEEANAYRLREIITALDERSPSDRTPEEKRKMAFDVGLKEYPHGKPLDIPTDELHRIRDWMVLEKARYGEEAQFSLVLNEDGSWKFWLYDKPNNDVDDMYIVLNLHRILSVLK